MRAAAALGQGLGQGYECEHAACPLRCRSHLLALLAAAARGTPRGGARGPCRGGAGRCAWAGGGLGSACAHAACPCRCRAHRPALPPPPPLSPPRPRARRQQRHRGHQTLCGAVQHDRGELPLQIAQVKSGNAPTCGRQDARPAATCLLRLPPTASASQIERRGGGSLAPPRRPVTRRWCPPATCWTA